MPHLPYLQRSHLASGCPQGLPRGTVSVQGPRDWGTGTDFQNLTQVPQAAVLIQRPRQPVRPFFTPGPATTPPPGLLSLGCNRAPLHGANYRLPCFYSRLLPAAERARGGELPALGPLRICKHRTLGDRR